MVSGMGNLRRIKYVGTNPQLVSGNYYTYKEFAKIAGVGYRCFVSRANGKFVITDAMLEPLNAHLIPKKWRNQPNQADSRFDHPFDVISQTYLRKKL